MQRDWLLTNATLVLPDRVVSDGDLLIEQGRIAAVEAAHGSATPVDLHGAYVLPGLIDLHSDAIEQHVEPRQQVLFPIEQSLQGLERLFASWGITTAFHAISFEEGKSVARSTALAAQLIEAVASHASDAMIRHRVHLRYEVTRPQTLPVVAQLIERGSVHVLSFMDHTKERRQFATFIAHRRAADGDAGQSCAARAGEVKERTAALDDLVSLASTHRLPVVSHDDDSADKVTLAHEWGARVSEFPVRLEAARHADSLGMWVAVGAPNIVRGGSQSNSLRAVDLVTAGLAGILCSDYYPAALLQAVFSVGTTVTCLPAAVRLATLHPARALGLDGEFGSLEPGKVADLIIVRLRAGVPLVTGVLLGGEWVYRAGPPTLTAGPGVRV